MKILNLPLKAKWYKMIESGVKKEEYREINPYWSSRILGSCPFVRFRYGYTKKTMLFKLNEISIGKGNPEWGAPTDKDVFILKLGNRVEQEESK